MKPKRHQRLTDFRVVALLELLGYPHQTDQQKLSTVREQLAEHLRAVLTPKRKNKK
jgi:hypothetical protein